MAKSGTKILNIKEEAKQAKENLFFLAEKIKNHPWIALVIIIVLVLLLASVIYGLVKGVPFSEKKLGLTPQEPVCEDERMTESVFSMYNEGKDWELGENYTFTWTLNSKVRFKGKAIVYLRPALESGFRPPVVVSIDKPDKSFEAGKYVDFTGLIDTTNASKGRYNLCGIIKDENTKSGYYHEYCDNRQIGVG